jgi:hypothetical protein
MNLSVTAAIPKRLMLSVTGNSLNETLIGGTRELYACSRNSYSWIEGIFRNSTVVNT